jgi:hypothetical protein
MVIILKNEIRKIKKEGTLGADGAVVYIREGNVFQKIIALVVVFYNLIYSAAILGIVD